MIADIRGPMRSAIAQRPMADIAIQVAEAYVGMSIQLKTRMSGHEVLDALNIPGYWSMRWFKPTPVCLLRSVERGYIQKYDPPWNISGRARGLVLQ